MTSYDRAIESCSDWNVQVRASPRVMIGTLTQAPYDTEHVFEGQQVGQFFNEYIWLGRMSWSIDKRKVVTGDPTWNCAWTMSWIRDRKDDTWDRNGLELSFADRILMEMGGMEHLDRLVVFARRPNIDKGALMGGGEVYKADNFGKKGYQEQLLLMKELGMAFTYMNIPAIVNKYCATYEGIYALMGQFDTWYVPLPDSRLRN